MNLPTKQKQNKLMVTKEERGGGEDKSGVWYLVDTNYYI